MAPIVLRHVVRSKLVPPALPDGLVVRERLFERFDAGRRLTLVSALPGYGKTALVRQWIDTVDVPVAWLSLDMVDQEPLVLWSHLLAALQGALGSTAAGAADGLDDEPALLLLERGAGDPLFLGALAAQLESTGRPVVLVLDGANGQLDQAVLDGVGFLVERAGEGFRVVMTARSEPSLPLARWRALGWLADLREDELRLTDEEALALAAATDTSFRDEADVLALNRRVDGWPIGLHMALLARPSGAPAGPGAADLRDGSDRLLASYLVGEVLAAMDPDEREVALALSVLVWFDPDMCEQLLGGDRVEAVGRLLRRGPFLTVVDARTGAMQFHDLFRELLEIELGRRDPARRLALHRRAALVWRARGDLMSAYHHLAAIGEADRARELLLGPVFELVDSGDLEELRQFARRLPSQHAISNPNLALDLATIALVAEGTVAARAWCDRAALLMTEQPGPATDRLDTTLRLHDVRCAVALQEADLDAARADLAARQRLARSRLAATAFETRFPILAARISLAARQRDDADRWITAAERLDGPEIVVAVTVPTLRAWFEWLFGRLDRAVALMDGALLWLDDQRVGPHHLAFDALITGGWCRLSTGDVTSATRLAERAVRDAEALANPWNQLQAGYLTARVALTTGDPVRALGIVDELRTAVGFDTCHPYSERIVGVEIEALVAAGRLTEAAPLVAAMELGARRTLLLLRLGHVDRDETEQALADRATWPVVERIQGELVHAARRPARSRGADVLELVSECGRTGWVLPFLGLGPGVEHVLRALPLEQVHPRLAAALAFTAPARSLVGGEGGGVRLTSREVSLLELLPTHLSYADMGEQLCLSVNTVKSNLKTLYRKLDATTRAEAVDAGRRNGLI